MQRLTFSATRPLSILAVGAHADDIEIGAGGTILRLLDDRPGSSIQWVVASASPARADEARSSAAAFSTRAKQVDVLVADLPDGRLPSVAPAFKDVLESIKGRSFEYEFWLPFERTPTRITGWSPRRSGKRFEISLVAEYEIPKYDGDLGKPNLFVDLNEETCERKISLLMQVFPSQVDRRWWSPDTFRAILRLRGIEAATAYAEAFHCRKLVL